MGVAPFVMVLIGCSQGASSCAPIATMPVAYASEASCLDARADILSLSSGLGYARVIAECRPHGSAAPRKANLRTVPTA